MAIASLTRNQSSKRRCAEKLSNAGGSSTEEAEIFGDSSEEITVEIDTKELVEMRLSPQTLAEQINLSDAKVFTEQYRSDTSNIAVNSLIYLVETKYINSIYFCRQQFIMA